MQVLHLKSTGIWNKICSESFCQVEQIDFLIDSLRKMVVIPRFERINNVMQEIYSVPLIYSVLHLFYQVIILFLIPVIRSDDPFRASSGSKRSKRVTPGDTSYQYCIPTSTGITTATPTTATSGATTTTVGNGILPGKGPLRPFSGLQGIETVKKGLYRAP